MKSFESTCAYYDDWEVEPN